MKTTPRTALIAAVAAALALALGLSVLTAQDDAAPTPHGGGHGPGAVAAGHPPVYLLVFGLHAEGEVIDEISVAATHGPFHMHWPQVGDENGFVANITGELEPFPDGGAFVSFDFEIGEPGDEEVSAGIKTNIAAREGKSYRVGGSLTFAVTLRLGRADD